MSSVEHMTRLSSTPDSQVELPPEVQQLLLDVVADGFVVYCCGGRKAQSM